MSGNDSVSVEVQKMMQEIIREQNNPDFDPKREFTGRMYAEELSKQGIQISVRAVIMRLDYMVSKGILTKRRVNIAGKTSMAYTKVKKEGD